MRRTTTPSRAVLLLALLASGPAAMRAAPAVAQGAPVFAQGAPGTPQGVSGTAPGATATAGGAPAAAQGVSAAAPNAPLVAEACLGCHGPGGAGGNGVPALAGRDRAELLAALAAFRANERPATIMNRIVRGYSEAELFAAVDHFAGGR